MNEKLRNLDMIKVITVLHSLLAEQEGVCGTIEVTDQDGKVIEIDIGKETA